MEIETQYELTNVCRICMINTGKMESIFETVYDSISLHSMIILCIPTINILPTDELPDKICLECKPNLLAAFNFHQVCVNSDKQLRLILNEKLLASKKKSAEVPVAVTNVPNKESDGRCNGEAQDVLVIKPAADPEVKKTGKHKHRKSKSKIEHKNIKGLRYNHRSNANSKPNKVKKIQRKLRKTSENFKEEVPSDIEVLDRAMKNSVNLIDLEDTSVDVEQNEEGEIQIYKCEQCSELFSDEDNYSSHTNDVHKLKEGNIEYICKICSKKFARLYSLNRHLGAHKEKRKYKCKTCDKNFTTKYNLINHLCKVKEFKPHICHICNKSFQQKCTLKDHLRTHSGETPFLCAQCGKAFNNSSNLRQHLIRHSGVKPYECTQCPSKFSCKGGLKSHLATHAGLRPYTCDTCGASFTKPYSLKKHKRIHTGERPYACDVCEMRFNSSDHVKRHKRTHTGEKPYKCKFCDRAFAQSNDLVKHTRSHVGINTYQCDQCSMSFRLHTELRAHWQIHFSQNNSDNNEKKGDDDFLIITPQENGIESNPTPLEDLPIFMIKCLSTDDTDTATNSLSSKTNEAETYSLLNQDILQHFQQHNVLNRTEGLAILPDGTELHIFNNDSEELKMLSDNKYFIVPKKELSKGNY